MLGEKRGRTSGTCVLGTALIVMSLWVSCTPRADQQAPPSGRGVIIHGDSISELAATVAAEVRFDGDSLGLSRVVSLRSAAANIAILDQVAGKVAIVDRDGKVVRWIGRTGNGPGELKRPSHMAAHGDTLFVVDGNGLQRFLTSGAFLGRSGLDLSAARATTNFTPYPQSLDHDGTRLITSFIIMPPRRRASPSPDSMSLHVMSDAGAVELPFAHVVSDEIYSEVGTSAPRLFGTRSAFAVSTNGAVAISSQDGVTITLVWPGSVDTALLRMSARRRRITGADEDTLFGLVRRLGAEDPESLNRQLAFMRGLPVADYRSAVGGMVAGDGLLLLKRLDLSPIDMHSAALARWDMIRTSGVAVGGVRLPARFKPWVVEDSVIWGVLLDSLDVPLVVKYKVGR